MHKFTMGDTVRITDNNGHTDQVGEITNVNIDTGLWVITVPDVGDVEVDPDHLVPADAQPEPVTPLDVTKTHLANTFWKLNEAKRMHLQKTREMMQAIKSNPELAALQAEIELWNGQADQLQSEYVLAIEQTRQAAITEHLNGQPKTRFDGLIQVRQLSGSVLHWDANKALEFAQSLESPEHRAVLIKTQADKVGFKKLAGIIEFPADAIVIGDSYTAAISEKDLIQHVTLDAIDDGDTEPIEPTTKHDPNSMQVPF